MLLWRFNDQLSSKTLCLQWRTTSESPFSHPMGKNSRGTSNCWHLKNSLQGIGFWCHHLDNFQTVPVSQKDFRISRTLFRQEADGFMRLLTQDLVYKGLNEWMGEYNSLKYYWFFVCCILWTYKETFLFLCKLCVIHNYLADSAFASWNETLKNILFSLAQSPSSSPRNSYWVSNFESLYRYLHWSVKSISSFLPLEKLISLSRPCLVIFGDDAYLFKSD